MRPPPHRPPRTDGMHADISNSCTTGCAGTRQLPPTAHSPRHRRRTPPTLLPRAGQMTTHAVQRRREARGARASGACAVCQRHHVGIPRSKEASVRLKCRGAPNRLKAKTLRSRSTPGAAQSYSSSWTRSARRSRLPRRTSHSRSTSTVGRIRCSRPSSGCATQQPRSHPRASSWRLRRLRRRRPTTLHAPTTRPMWQAVGRWGQARQRGGPRQRRTAARERWVSVVRRVARVKRRHSNARRGTRAHVPSAYRRRCG